MSYASSRVPTMQNYLRPALCMMLVIVVVVLSVIIVVAVVVAMLIVEYVSPTTHQKHSLHYTIS